MYGSIDIPSHKDIKMSNSKKGSSILSGVVNLSNTIIGAGMLGLPGAFGGTGWLSGIILIGLSATFSAHGLVLLSKAACLTGRPSSFYSVAMTSVPKYTILIDLAVALKCFGVATGTSSSLSLCNIFRLHVSFISHVPIILEQVISSQFLIAA